MKNFLQIGRLAFHIPLVAAWLVFLLLFSAVSWGLWNSNWCVAGSLWSGRDPTGFGS